MNTSARRLGFAMATALALLTLNAALVVSGVADGVYKHLPGSDRAEIRAASGARYTDSSTASVSRDCAGAERLHGPNATPFMPITVAARTPAGVLQDLSGWC